jgi:putative sterol carrier protein
MPAFPSADWASQFRAALNSNEAYAEAAAAWEGDFLLEVVPDSSAEGGPGVYLDLAHGTCRDARYVVDARALSAEFTFRGTAEDWRKVVRGEVDPIRAYLEGTIRLRGNPAKLMRFMRATRELLVTAAGVTIDP